MARHRGKLDPEEAKKLLRDEGNAKAGAPSFNNPFAAMKDQLESLVPPPSRKKTAAQRLADRERNPGQEPSQLALTRARNKAAREALSEAVKPVLRTAAEREAEEAQIFADAVAGAARIDADPRGRVRAPEPAPLPPGQRRSREDAESLATLSDLVEGRGSFSMNDTDEYLEFLAPGLDKRLLRDLRRGDFALQGHIDLHGMTRDEARFAVETFIEKSRAGGKRCVLIVHGRGLHSKDEVPILKARVKAWLERGRISKSVLAFASAQPSDGGTGAVYVLLRR